MYCSERGPHLQRSAPHPDPPQTTRESYHRERFHTARVRDGSGARLGRYLLRADKRTSRNVASGSVQGQKRTYGPGESGVNAARVRHRLPSHASTAAPENTSMIAVRVAPTVLGARSETGRSLRPARRSNSLRCMVVPSGLMSCMIVGDRTPLEAGSLGRLLREGGGDEGGDDAASAPAGMRQNVAHEVDAAALPRRCESLADRRLDAFMRI